MSKALDEIGSEEEWHEFLGDALERAGWYVKHEVTANNSDVRCDFLCYHSELNSDHESGEWVGIECKYRKAEYTDSPGLYAAAQITDKYRDEEWLNRGREVDLWVAAPYLNDSHRGGTNARAKARTAEIASAKILMRLGFGYLFSWHYRPGIATKWLDIPGSTDPRREAESDYVSAPGLPAFRCESKADPWESYRAHNHGCERRAEICRAKYEPALRRPREQLSEIRDKYSGGGDPDE
jgi:hypothetical protein